MTWRVVPTRFRQRIILGFSLLILLFLSAMVIVEVMGIPGTSNQGLFARNRANTLENMDLVSGVLSERISSWFKERRIDMDGLATAPLFRQTIEASGPTSQGSLGRELEAFLGSHPGINSVALLLPAGGEVLAARGGFRGVRSVRALGLDSDGFSRLMIPGYLETLEIQSSADKGPRLRIFRQVLSIRTPEKITAIVVSESDVAAALRPLFSSAGSRLSREWGCVMASNAGGEITPFSLGGRGDAPLRSVPSRDFGFSPIPLALSGVDAPYDGPDESGEAVLAFHRQIRVAHGVVLALVLKTNRAHALLPAWKDLYRHAILWVFMFVAGIGLCLLAARQISKPIKELALLARRVESGDLAARAPTTDTSEAGQLALVFNGMVARLETWHQDLEKQVLDRTRDLRLLSGRQKAILAAVPDIVMEVDNQWVCTWSNGTGLEFFGEGVIGQGVANYLENGGSLPSPADPGEALSLECWQRRQDGEFCLLAWRFRALQDDQGRVAGAIATARDITEGKRSEEKLRESERRFRGLLQSVDCLAVQGYDSVGVTQYWNHASELLYGYTAEEAVGRSLLDLIIPPEMREGVAHAIRQMSETGQSIPSAELSLMRKDGSRIAVYSNHAVMAIPGAGPEIFCMDIDLTDRKHLEAKLNQAQKMESLGSLAGGIAHDMNNVLGAILGLASANIEEQPVGSPIHNALDTISKAAVRGGKMVKTLLNFARQTPADERELDMNAILLEEVRLLERTTLSKVRMELDLAPELQAIRGDGSALTHAFMNLCVNAVDAMPESGTLTLRTRNVDTEWIEVVVEDTGIGMSKEVLGKALDPFFTTKDVGKGTGLGLSLVYSTVKAHRGQIELQSEPGLGTHVRILFPACKSKADATRAQEHPPTEILHRALKVLLVDDDELIQGSMKDVLGALGHETTIACCGEEALARLADGCQPDVVILDMNMPGLGGGGTLPQLRKVRPAVPVLLATGRVDQAALDLAGAHPSVTLLSKPFSLKELQKCLDAI